ncbi:hypothetical protein D3C72_788760 [compost metagenome]
MQQVRRQAGWNVAQQVVVKWFGRLQVGRDTGAEQQHQAVLVLGDLTGVLGQLRTGVFHRGARLCQVQGRGDADFVAAGGELVALLEGGEGVLGQLVQFLVGLPGQVGIGHAGHQADLRAAAAFFSGEVLLQRFFVQAANPTEQVEFIGADANSCRVGTGDAGFAGLGSISRKPLTAAAAIGRDGREQIGTGDAVLSRERVDVQGRDTQVTVVFQGNLDQLLQRRVMEKLLPALLGSRLRRCLGRRVRRALRVLARHRRFGLLIVRYQRAATEHEGGDCQGE